MSRNRALVVPYIGTWIETLTKAQAEYTSESYLIQVRGLKLAIKDKRIIASSRTLYRYVD